MRKSLVLITFLILAASGMASAAQDIRLEFYDQVYTQGSTLMLKQVLQQQHPRLNVRALDLRGATLVAKSNMGRGEAYLSVSGMSSRLKQITGSPYDFHSPRPDTFDRVGFRNPAPGAAAGPWQIHLRGRIKVRAVILRLAGPGPGPFPGPSFVTADCDADSHGNFLRPKMDVECSVRGVGATSYEIKLGSVTLWRGALNPRDAFQTFKTDQKKVIGGRVLDFTVVLYDRSGRAAFVDTFH